MQIYSIFRAYDQQPNAFLGAGQRTIMVLTAGCNLFCAHCDRRDAAAFQSTRRLMSPAEVLQEIERLSCGFRISKVTIQGGEPLCQTKQVVELIALLESLGYRTTILTNGSVALPSPLVRNQQVTRFVVNYKLPSSRMDQLMPSQLFSLLEGIGVNDLINLRVSDDADLRRCRELLVLNRDRFDAEKIFISLLDSRVEDLAELVRQDAEWPDEFSITTFYHSSDF